MDGADEEQRLRDMFVFKRGEEDGINEGGKYNKELDVM